MTWPQQVLHVLRSDARSLWPFFVLHISALAYGVLQARGDVAVTDGLNTGPLYFYGSAMLFAALLMHRHGPASPTAHWSALPYDRSAVWAAKWSMLVVLLACGIGATIVAVQQLPFPEDYAEKFTLGKSAALCGAVASAALVGSLRRELRTVLLLLLGLPFAAFIALTLPVFLGVPGALIGTNLHVLTSTGIVFLGIMLAMLASLWFYRSPGISAAAHTWAMFGCIALLAGVLAVPTTSLDHRIRNDASAVRVMPMHEELAGVAAFAERDHSVDTSAAAAETRAMRLHMSGAPTNLRARWQSSSQRIVRQRFATSFSGSGSSRDLYVPALTILPALRWLEGTNKAIVFSDSAADGLHEWPVQSAVRSRDGVGLEVTSVVRFSRPVVIARLPLAVGERADTFEHQFVILQRGGSELICEEPQLVNDCVAPYPNQSLLRLQLRAIGGEQPDLAFALVNATRGEAIRTHAHGDNTRSVSSGIFVPSDLQTTQWLLIPGPAYIRRPGAPPLPLDDEWLRDAELVIVEWVPVGEVPVTIVSDSSLAPPSER